MNLFSSRDPAHYVTVPSDATSTGLILSAFNRLIINTLDRNLGNWQFLKDEAGKTFEVLIWEPGFTVSARDVREYFNALGADGNVAAFVAWLTERDPIGYYISIPSDDSHLFKDRHNRDLCVPYYSHRKGHKRLTLYEADDGWGVGWRFVAFREIERT